MYKVFFYWDDRGRMPVREMIDSLPDKMRQKVSAWIDLLEREGPLLKRPYADKVRGKLYELRIRLAADNVRILYFFFVNKQIILLHGFRKKSWEIKLNDLEIAESRMENFIARYKEDYE